TVKTVDAILFAYMNKARPPAHATFVLDVSGSMGDDGKIQSLKRALSGLTGLDHTLTGVFSQFHDREQLTFVRFSNVTYPPVDFTGAGRNRETGVYPKIRSFVDSLWPGGGTAIYSALIEVYQDAMRAEAGDPNRYYSIVLMTDGENNAGASAEDFIRFYRGLPNAGRIRTFTVLFGDASAKALDQIATLTGGKLFDARTASLSSVFKEIRGYQ